VGNVGTFRFAFWPVWVCAGRVREAPSGGNREGWVPKVGLEGADRLVVVVKLL
jgi:hypothetical protein